MQTYHTQMEAARENIITPQMKTVAEKERVDVEWLRERVAAGTICIPANIHHTSLSAEGIGTGLRTKINVNLGISGDCHDYTDEMKKLTLRFSSAAKPSWTYPITEKPARSGNS